MNQEFHIEKSLEHETDFLLREIRKIIAEKMFSYLRMVETLLSPSNAPMFVFSMVKALGTDEKKELGEIYKELAKMELSLMKLDLEYSEKKEAEFIKKALKTWNKISKKTMGIIEIIEKNWENKIEGKSKGYFG